MNWPPDPRRGQPADGSLTRYQRADLHRLAVLMRYPPIASEPKRLLRWDVNTARSRGLEVDAEIAD